MEKSGNLNGNFEYELLDEHQQVIDLREKLAVLYASFFADILWWELRDPSLIDKGYYKLLYYEQNVLKHIILFQYSVKTSKKIKVITQQFNISSVHIENVCRILFNEFDKVRQIIFRNIFEPEHKQLHNTIFEKTIDDVIISLPKSIDTYIKSLGVNTRKDIRKNMNRVARDFPGFEVQYFEKSDIVPEQMENIASLNRIRMKMKGIESHQTDNACKLQYQYASTSGFGFTCICTINRKMVGGYIGFIIGEHAYVYIGGYDTSYNKYSMGQVSMIHVFQYLIEEKNIKYCHMLDSTLGYKIHFGGIVHGLYVLRVFRNNGIYYFCYIIFKNIIVYYWKLKSNKIFNSFFIKLKRRMLDICCRVNCDKPRQRRGDNMYNLGCAKRNPCIKR